MFSSKLKMFKLMLKTVPKVVTLCRGDLILGRKTLRDLKNFTMMKTKLHFPNKLGVFLINWGLWCLRSFMSTGVILGFASGQFLVFSHTRPCIKGKFNYIYTTFYSTVTDFSNDSVIVNTFLPVLILHQQ